MVRQDVASAVDRILLSGEDYGWALGLGGDDSPAIIMRDNVTLITVHEGNSVGQTKRSTR